MSIESESWRLFHEHRSEIKRLRAENAELRSENAALREENLKLKKVIHDQGDEIRTLHIFNAAGAAIDAARKEAKP